MKIAIFGLTLSSAWGNGHATPYRAIIRALNDRGVQVTFYEKDVPYYARQRDFHAWGSCELVLYSDWDQIRGRALREARECDIVISASYCPEGARIADEMLELHRPLRVFYDLDTPVTLRGLETGDLDYLRRDQIPEFDFYLSFTGGPILERLQTEFGAQFAHALYGCVDPDIYVRVPPQEEFACDLSYMGTYAANRQARLDKLFLEPARRHWDLSFFLAGSLYPPDWEWPENVRRNEHVVPGNHPALYSSSRATLNITREDMATSGYCPSGRFFEAAACGTPVLTDNWDGLDSFFAPGREVLLMGNADDVLSALTLPCGELRLIAENARRRTLDEHTGSHRATEFLNYCEKAGTSKNKRSKEVAP